MVISTHLFLLCMCICMDTHTFMAMQLLYIIILLIIILIFKLHRRPQAGGRPVSLKLIASVQTSVCVCICVHACVCVHHKVINNQWCDMYLIRLVKQVLEVLCMPTVVVIVNGRGLGIYKCQTHQPTKSWLSLYKALIHCSSH